MRFWKTASLISSRMMPVPRSSPQPKRLAQALCRGPCACPSWQSSDMGPPRNSPLALVSSPRTAALVNGLTGSGGQLRLEHVVRCRTMIAGLSS